MLFELKKGGTQEILFKSFKMALITRLHNLETPVAFPVGLDQEVLTWIFSRCKLEMVRLKMGKISNWFLWMFHNGKTRIKHWNIGPHDSLEVLSLCFFVHEFLTLIRVRGFHSFSLQGVCRKSFLCWYQIHGIDRAGEDSIGDSVSWNDEHRQVAQPSVVLHSLLERNIHHP